MSVVAVPSAPTAPEVLAPVIDQERIELLDVLRGLALLGVVVANVWLWFSGIAFRFPAYLDELRQVSLDSAVFFVIGVFVSGKAMSTFSFLFGLGFAIQMLRAEARGRSVVPVYARRLAVLLVIGTAHMVLLWYGDILAAYAALGFALMLFRKRRDRTVLMWAAILVAAVPLLLGGIPWAAASFGAELPQPKLEEIAQRNAATLAVFQAGSYPDILTANLEQAGKFYLGRKAPWVLYILGLFLLGLYVGRRRVLEAPEAYRPQLRRIAQWGIPVGLAGSTGSAVMQTIVPVDALMSQPPLIFLSMVLFTVGTVPLAAGYVSAVTLLFARPEVRRRLALFAPAGRMALTNYLSQTVIMLLIFYPYGGGLIGRTGPAVGLSIALAVFAVQMAWSRAWLARFQFGPMEWVWRSLTYGRLQPMRIPQRVAPLAG